MEKKRCICTKKYNHQLNHNTLSESTLPLSVFEYMDQYVANVDVRQFTSICKDGTNFSARDQQYLIHMKSVRD